MFFNHIDAFDNNSIFFLVDAQYLSYSSFVLAGNYFYLVIDLQARVSLMHYYMSSIAR